MLNQRLSIFATALILAVLLVGCGTPHPEGLVFKTADENLSFLVLIPQAEVIPAEEVGAVEPDPLPEPPCEVIKGNISRTGEKIAHSPGQANYDNVRIDEAAGEKFFCSLEEAEAEGWRPARN